MRQKIKNLFSYLNKLRKTMLFTCPVPKQSLWFGAVVFFIVLGIFLPSHASAFSLDFIGDYFSLLKDCFGVNILTAGVNILIMGFAAFLFGQILVLTNVSLLLSAGLLDIVTHPAFISLSYTDPARNPLLKIGWEFTRDFANMGFVIALVFIGLGTALRLGEYQWQKTLPRLIIIALLINFTPVLLGVIVDASNIIMHAFLQDGINLDSMLTIWEKNLNPVRRGISSMCTEIKEELVGRVIALVFFGAIGSAILIIYAILFIMRYIAIWMLVILSPIAFFCYILPATRKYWSMWWNQFIQWCFIGVFAGFFLYLTTHLLKNIPVLERLPEKGVFGPLAGLLNEILPYGIVIGFLIIGLFVGLSTSAMGADAVINFGKKTTKALGSAYAKKKKAEAVSWGRKKVEESDKAKRIMERMEGLSKVSFRPTWGEGQSGPLAWTKRRAAGLTGAATAPITEALRGTGRTLGIKFGEQERKMIEETEKQVEKDSVDMVISKFKSAADWATKIGFLNRLVKKGDIDEAIEKGLDMGQDIAPTYVYAKQYDAHKDIQSSLPRLEEGDIRRAAGLPSSRILPRAAMDVAQRRILSEYYRDELINKIKPNRAGFVSRQILNDEIIMDAIAKSWSGAHVSKFVESHGIEGMQAIENAITRIGGMIQLNVVNPKLAQYIRSSAGQNLGFSIT